MSGAEPDVSVGAGAGGSNVVGSRWRLSACLAAHSLDVRGVAATLDGCIVSASRDNTAKLWHPTGVRDFSNVVTYKGHNNFVSSVCVLPPCESHPEGLILTASNDKTILGYNIDDPIPVLVLKGHENTVCCVTTGHIPGIILSASWDSTGGIWSANNPEKPLHILKGHQAVVWGIVELGNHNIATASADKTVCLWSSDGKKLKALSGHTDCVRALAVASPETFLSCANDASVRLWTNQGECLNTFFGHSNYIYSICSNPFVEGQCFVTGGEDSTVRVWSGGDIICTITLPAQSVWSVACLYNGDIVAGSSDGLVRVFTRDITRQADESTLKQFEEEVVKLHEASTQEIGGVKVTDLPGPEVLFEPGKTDGQTKLVRSGAKVKCYSWDAASQKWNEIGDVMGSAGPTEGKQMYQGKEYDFVFSVDIEDGKPPIKLPYNLDEDPWVAAQAFIHKNQLPQAYLEQVANFIVQNSKAGDNLPIKDSGYMDPFTGGSRYIPTGAQNTQGAAPVIPNSSVNNKSSQGKESFSYFPQKTYLRFDKADCGAILFKLKEFNSKINDINLRVTDNDLEAVMMLADQKSGFNLDVVNKLKHILMWPQELLFPVLDTTRLAIRDSDTNAELFSANDFGPILMKIIRNNLGPGNPAANQLLSLRTFVNGFAHKHGELLILKEHENILNVLICLQNFNKNMQIAIATFLLNLCVALGKQPNTIFLCQCVLEMCTKFTENEALFRILVALGTLVVLAPKKSDITSITNMHSEFIKKLQLYSTSDAAADPTRQKVSVYSQQILQLL
ncbi:phospholipase A2 activator protein [Arctopsyche grandis]|uniref:phospholipase A2 activator protein n=1 Tax=Arctopsyche grandis TaxID=121162 RepID=UPI00406D6CDB